MRFLELLEDEMAPVADTVDDQPATPAPSPTKVYYHVTTQARLRSIQANGLEPNHNRRWKTGYGKHLGDRGNLYLMSDFTAAVRWAFKQQWEHFNGKTPDKSPYIILCVRENPKLLEPDPHPESGLYGHSWFQKKGVIAPDEIMKVIPLTKELIKQVVDGSEAVTEGDSIRGIGSNFNYRKCVRALLAKGWHEGNTPNEFANPDYPEYSIDLDIHSVQDGPFTVFQGAHKIAVTKVPPFAQQLALKDRLL